MKSIPIYPAPPKELLYAVSELYTVKTYTRATASAAGANPPTFDPTKRPKGWAFTNAKDLATPAGRVYVWLFNPLTGLLEHHYMPWQEAEQFNLPGMHSYPQYVVEPTAAFINLVTGPQQIDAYSLSTIDEAHMIAGDFGLTVDAISEYSLQGFPVTYPTTEARRQYQVLYNGNEISVAPKVRQKYANGIGAPGNWDLTPAEPVWESSIKPPDPGPMLPAWSTPCRPLLSTESILVATMPGNWLVHRSS